MKIHSAHCTTNFFENLTKNRLIMTRIKLISFVEFQIEFKRRLGNCSGQKSQSCNGVVHPTTFRKPLIKYTLVIEVVLHYIYYFFFSLFASTRNSFVSFFCLRKMLKGNLTRHIERCALVAKARMPFVIHIVAQYSLVWNGMVCMYVCSCVFCAYFTS